MVRFGPGLVFIPNTEKLLLWVFKIERKITNQSLGGFRTENQGVQSPQTFLVKMVFILQSPEKHDRRSQHFQVSFDDRSHI